MRYFSSILIAISFFLGCNSDHSLNPVLQNLQIDYLEIGIEHEDYIQLKSNKIKNYYVPMYLKKENDNLQGRIRALGAGSRYMNKWGYKVELKEGDFRGLKEFNLSANIIDKTGLLPLVAKEYFANLGFEMYDIYPVAVSLNHGDISFYPLIERFEKSYFDRRNKPVAEIFEGGFNAKFTNVNNPFPENYFRREYPDGNSLTTLTKFFEFLDHTPPEQIYERSKEYIDIDSFLKFHVAMTILANHDAQRNNILMYTERLGGPIKFIPWDLDNLLSNIANFRFYADNEIIATLLKSKEIRIEYAKEFLYQLKNCMPHIPEYFDKYKSKIADVYHIDPYLGYFYNLDKEIEKYKRFAIERNKSLLAEYNSFFDNSYYINGLQ